MFVLYGTLVCGVCAFVSLCVVFVHVQVLCCPGFRSAAARALLGLGASLCLLCICCCMHTVSGLLATRAMTAWAASCCAALCCAGLLRCTTSVPCFGGGARHLAYQKVLTLSAGVLCCAVVLQEVKSGDASRVRSLLARVTSLALPPKKMKGFFRSVCGGGRGSARSGSPPPLPPDKSSSAAKAVDY